MLNGLELSASTEEQERVMLAVASGILSRESFANWVRGHVVSTGG